MNTIYLYFSDLHLEHYGKKKKEAVRFIMNEVVWFRENHPGKAIHVIAAGDISIANKSYTYEFFDELCSLADNVFYVFGNHEYYGDAYKSGIRDFKEKYANGVENLHVLQDDTVEYDDHVVIGSTLWTDYNGRDYTVMSAASTGMNDYKKIRLYKTKGVKLSPFDIVDDNMRSKNYIFSQTKKYSEEGKKVIVVTHHAPVCTRYHKEKQLLDYAYHNNFETKLAFDIAPDFWIFGHTHQKFNQDVGDSKILSNALGYPDQLEEDEKYLAYFEV